MIGPQVQGENGGKQKKQKITNKLLQKIRKDITQHNIQAQFVQKILYYF